MPTDLKIRNMSRPEVDQLVSWAAHEGWNPGLHDAELFWRADPEWGSTDPRFAECRAVVRLSVGEGAAAGVAAQFGGQADVSGETRRRESPAGRLRRRIWWLNCLRVSGNCVRHAVT